MLRCWAENVRVCGAPDDYVVNRRAVEDCDLPSTAKFKGQISSSGEQIVRDAGHRGMSLGDFCAHEMATAAELTQAEVAALRLYSGKLWAACKRRMCNVEPSLRTL